MKKLFVITIAMSSFACAGKGRSNNPFKAAAQATEMRDLQGTFKEACNQNVPQGIVEAFKSLATAALKGDALVRSTQTSFSVEGDALTKTTEVFNKTQCENKLYTIETIGSIKTETDQSKFNNEGGRPAKMRYEIAKVTPHGADGVKYLNDKGYCGKTDWQDGKSKEVTSQAADETNCLGYKLAVQTENFVYLKDGRELHWGTSAVKDVSEADRPTTVENAVYIKQ